MTKHALRFTGLLCLCMAALPCAPALAKDPPAPLPEGVVARVAGRELTFDGFCIAAAQQKLPQLKHKGSNATTILRGLIELKIVEQEARRLGVTVSEADVKQRFDAFEAQVRRKFRGQKTLQELMKEQGTNPVEFRAGIRDQLLKEGVAGHDQHLGDTLPKNERKRLLQSEIVIDKLRKRAKATYAVPTCLSPDEPTSLGSGVIAQVSSPGAAPTPITMQEFGRQLVMRMTSGDVREMLDVEVKSGLLASAGFRMSDEDFDREVELQRKHWTVQRELASQAALETVTYDDWINAKYRMTVDEMKTKRYWRGYLALIQRMRDTVTPEEVRAEYEKKKETHWGQYLLVTEISAEFVTEGGFQRPNVRTHRQAQRVIRDVPRQLAQGVPFEQVVRQINAARDPTFRAQRRRIRPNTDDLELWQRASQMKDGDLSSPFETLTHVHLLRRDSLHPAPSFEDIEVVVRESIARRKAREWVDERVKDEGMAQVRWPFPQRGGV